MLKMHGCRIRNRINNFRKPLLIAAALLWIPCMTGIASGQINSSKEYIYLNGRVIATESGDGTLASAVPTPTTLVASYLSRNQIKVQWCIGAYAAASYEIERLPGGIISIGGGQGCLEYIDSTVSGGMTYAYRIRAKDSLGNAGSFSNRDIATVMTFPDDPVIAGNTAIKAQHFMDLRQAVASVRTCANLSAPSWTDATLSGATIKAVHLTEIRDQLNQARAALSVQLPDYADATIVPNSTIVKAAHVNQIRDKVR